MQSLSRRAGKTRSRDQALQNGKRRVRQNRLSLSASPKKRTRATSAKPTLVIRKLPEPTQPSSVPPLPPRKPEQDHSPTSATREGSGTIEQETEGKFKAAEAKAKREGVHSLTSEDIEGLSDEQIKQLRGY